MGRRYDGYVINGFRFHTKDLERKRKCQNSGVVVVATTQSYASAKDLNPVSADVTYFGVLQEIIQLDYWLDKTITLFKCDWVCTNRGPYTDDMGFTLVNMGRKMYGNDPFIFASQAQQVFYVQDALQPDWHIVIKTCPRDYYNMSAAEVVDGDDVFDRLQSAPINAANLRTTTLNYDDNVRWARPEAEGEVVDRPLQDNVESNMSNLQPNSVDYEETRDDQSNNWFDY